MRKLCKTLVLVLVFIFCYSSISYAEEYISINDLIEGAKQYDNEEVKIKGEAVGEIMKRGKYSWVNINDGSNVIGVWLSNDIASKISVLGDYKHKGDIIEVKGNFSRDCSEHGGDVDIHASSISIMEKGKLTIPQIKENRSKIALALVFSTIFLSFIFLNIKKRFNSIGER
ncbi:hypothetical protein [Desnuesiella massiliensis]|uniref:hypothetical protein n=1 Tax=Desnuesiella massiliensis TaxID=1650662 RepID=UPI0006E1B0D7|nr:hypothetical protein [Desnuesiella massiliensis]